MCIDGIHEVAKLANIYKQIMEILKADTDFQKKYDFTTLKLESMVDEITNILISHSDSKTIIKDLLSGFLSATFYLRQTDKAIPVDITEQYHDWLLSYTKTSTALVAASSSTCSANTTVS